MWTIQELLKAMPSQIDQPAIAAHALHAGERARQPYDAQPSVT